MKHATQRLSLKLFTLTLTFLSQILLANGGFTPSPSCFTQQQHTGLSELLVRYNTLEQNPFENPTAASIESPDRALSHPLLIEQVAGRRINAEQLKSLQRYEIGLLVSNFLSNYLEVTKQAASSIRIKSLECAEEALLPFLRSLEEERNGVLLTPTSAYWRARRQQPEAWSNDYHENAAIVFILELEKVEQMKKDAVFGKQGARPSPRLGAASLPWLPNLD